MSAKPLDDLLAAAIRRIDTRQELAKAHIRHHTMRTRGGKVVQVAEHEDSRQDRRRAEEDGEHPRGQARRQRKPAKAELDAHRPYADSDPELVGAIKAANAAQTVLRRIGDPEHPAYKAAQKKLETAQKLIRTHAGGGSAKPREEDRQHLGPIKGANKKNAQEDGAGGRRGGSPTDPSVAPAKNKPGYLFGASDEQPFKAGARITFKGVPGTVKGTYGPSGNDVSFTLDRPIEGQKRDYVETRRHLTPVKGDEAPSAKKSRKQATRDLAQEALKPRKVSSPEERAARAKLKADKEIAGHKTRLDQQKAAHSAGIQRQQAQHASELKRQDAEHQAKLQRDQAEHQATLAKQAEEHKAKLARETAAHQAQLTGIGDERKGRIAKESASHQAELAAQAAASRPGSQLGLTQGKAKAAAEAPRGLAGKREAQAKLQSRMFVNQPAKQADTKLPDGGLFGPQGQMKIGDEKPPIPSVRSKGESQPVKASTGKSEDQQYHDKWNKLYDKQKKLKAAYDTASAEADKRPYDRKVIAKLRAADDAHAAVRNALDDLEYKYKQAKKER